MEIIIKKKLNIFFPKELSNIIWKYLDKSEIINEKRNKLRHCMSQYGSQHPRERYEQRLEISAIRDEIDKLESVI